MPLLHIHQLRTQFFIDSRTYTAVNGISFDIRAGETLCLVGESGSGKSATALSILNLISEPGKITGGEIRLDGKDILKMNGSELRHIRGNRIAMIFQEPMTALNPVLTCGNQVCEAIVLHQEVTMKDAKLKAIELFTNVGLPDAGQKLNAYPHELSGGMRQRVMIAMALACKPDLLIADEPTTALDVTVQAQILKILKDHQKATGMSILLITHDFGIVAEMADRVAVMYAGDIVEMASVDTIFREPRHPYTVGLLQAIPSTQTDTEQLVPIPGQVPDASRLPTGCSFEARCTFANARCFDEKPSLTEVGDHHRSACFEWSRVEYGIARHAESNS